MTVSLSQLQKGEAGSATKKRSLKKDEIKEQLINSSH